MSSKISKGKIGEAAAIDFLKQKGHEILDVNYRRERKEIDIISLDGRILVFTEVKTRSNFDFGYPEEAVDSLKQEHIKSVAEIFLLENEQYQQVRFDIISVLLNHNIVVEIVHWEGAFY
ncbi:MAG TPA: YraN family protein [Edaphocola sp.]|nr:YraN family protein [Edaphocola sp.]